MSSQGQAEPETVKSCLHLLGLAARGGAIQPGTARVREAGRSGLLQLAIIASDVSENTRDKLIPLLDARRIPYAVLGTRAELGVAVGRAPLSAVGVLSGTLAERILELIKPNSDQRAGISE